MGNQCVKESDDDVPRKQTHRSSAAGQKAKGNKYEATARIMSLEHVEHPHAKMCESSKIEPNFREYGRIIAPQEAALAIAACDTWAGGAKQLLLAGEDKSMSLLNYETGHVMKQWKRAHDRDINCLTNPHATSGLFCSGSRDTSVRLWKSSEDSPLHVLKGHTLNVTSVSMHSDGNLIASGSRDNTVRLWDVETGSELASQDVKLNLVHFVRFVPPLHCIVQGGEDLTLRLWDIRANSEGGGRAGLELKATYGNFDYHPTCCDGHFQDADRCHIVYTGHNGFNQQGSMITEWDLRTGRQVRQFDGHTFSVRSVKILRSERLASNGLQGQLLSASDDGSLRFWPLPVDPPAGSDVAPSEELPVDVPPSATEGPDEQQHATEAETANPNSENPTGGPSPSVPVVGAEKQHVTQSRKFDLPEGQVTCIDETKDGLLLLSLRNGTAVILRPQGSKEDPKPMQRFRYVGNPAATEKP
mmetsp:Transcript_65550/g.76249  ORF Transcript_65550/g.76249 Transcript_65550/m.76249 type:complete len:472 (-) Transcript_65550:442-1857(-)